MHTRLLQVKGSTTSPNNRRTDGVSPLWSKYIICSRYVHTSFHFPIYWNSPKLNFIFFDWLSNLEITEHPTQKNYTLVLFPLTFSVGICHSTFANPHLITKQPHALTECSTEQRKTRACFCVYTVVSLLPMCFGTRLNSLSGFVLRLMERSHIVSLTLLQKIFWPTFAQSAEKSPRQVLYMWCGQEWRAISAISINE